MKRKEDLYIMKKCQKCTNDCKQQSSCKSANIEICKKYKKSKLTK